MGTFEKWFTRKTTRYGYEYGDAVLELDGDGDQAAFNLRGAGLVSRTAGDGTVYQRRDDLRNFDGLHCLSCDGCTALPASICVIAKALILLDVNALGRVEHLRDAQGNHVRYLDFGRADANIFRASQEYIYFGRYDSATLKGIARGTIKPNKDPSRWDNNSKGITKGDISRLRRYNDVYNKYYKGRVR